MRRVLYASSVAMVLATACGGWGSGSDWVKQPLAGEEERAPMPSEESSAQPRRPARTLAPSAKNDPNAARGRVLGTFRNTYYDFPREADHTGDLVDVMDGSCRPIAKVARGFFEAVCVQGSGSLKRGGTISFAKRDCACAETCPRTGQKICFDALDPVRFPWGRGATGKPIAPLRTVAADPAVLPMGTVLYIPELDGAGDPPSDGCFVVEDRGVRVQGEHVDIFTGQPAQTAMLNRQVPSNQGVTVVVDAPKCGR